MSLTPHLYYIDTMKRKVLIVRPSKCSTFVNSRNNDKDSDVRTLMYNKGDVDVIYDELIKFALGLDELAKLCGQYHRVIVHSSCIGNEISFLNGLFWLLDNSWNSDTCDPIAIVVVGCNTMIASWLCENLPRVRCVTIGGDVIYLIPEDKLQAAIDNCKRELAQNIILPLPTDRHRVLIPGSNAYLVVYDGKLHRVAEKSVMRKLKRSVGGLLVALALSVGVWSGLRTTTTPQVEVAAAQQSQSVGPPQHTPKIAEIHRGPHGQVVSTKGQEPNLQNVTSFKTNAQTPQVGVAAEQQSQSVGPIHAGIKKKSHSTFKTNAKTLNMIYWQDITNADIIFQHMRDITHSDYPPISITDEIIEECKPLMTAMNTLSSTLGNESKKDVTKMNEDQFSELLTRYRTNQHVHNAEMQMIRHLKALKHLKALEHLKALKGGYEFDVSPYVVLTVAALHWLSDWKRRKIFQTWEASRRGRNSQSSEEDPEPQAQQSLLPVETSSLVDEADSNRSISGSSLAVASGPANSAGTESVNIELSADSVIQSDLKRSRTGSGNEALGGSGKTRKLGRRVGEKVRQIEKVEQQNIALKNKIKQNMKEVDEVADSNRIKSGSPLPVGRVGTGWAKIGEEWFRVGEEGARVGDAVPNPGFQSGQWNLPKEYYAPLWHGPMGMRIPSRNIYR